MTLRRRAWLAAGLVLLGAQPARAAGQATADEAVAMVRRGVALLKAEGLARACAEINRAGGPFHDRDLYLVLYGLDGVVRAHGANAQLIGQNLEDARDVDGRYFVRERIALARRESRFWHDYQFVNPVSRRVEPKRMYCERVGEQVVCGGIYLE